MSRRRHREASRLSRNLPRRHLPHRRPPPRARNRFPRARTRSRRPSFLRRVRLPPLPPQRRHSRARARRRCDRPHRSSSSRRSAHPSANARAAARATRSAGVSAPTAAVRWTVLTSPPPHRRPALPHQLQPSPLPRKRCLSSMHRSRQPARLPVLAVAVPTLRKCRFASFAVLDWPPDRTMAEARPTGLHRTPPTRLRSNIRPPRPSPMLG